MHVLTATRSTVASARFAEAERRVDGHQKVSGRMKYAADIQRPNALWAAFVTSPVARARLLAVDATAAQTIPGVRAVLTGADIGPRMIGRQIRDWPILARDEVRFIGDRIAAVAAETREAAEAAARAIEVRYAELPPLLDGEAALAADAPILHPDFDRYLSPLFPAGRPPRPHPNVQGFVVLRNGAGEPEAVFPQAAHVFSHEFETPRQHCGYLEPRATIVWIDDDGRVHVHSSHKMPFSLREQLAAAADIPVASVVIEPAAIGGDFGGKGFTQDEYPCYFLAKATGRPVRYVQRYAEELGTGTTRHRARMRLTTAVAADGRFLAHASRVVLDGGAYAAPKALPTLLPGYAYGAIPYHVPVARLEVLAVYTNTLPGGHVRGPSEVQTFFAWEQHVDTIARALGRDPLELRLQNALRDGQTALNGDRIEAPTTVLVLETLQRELARTPRRPGQGRGIALVSGRTGGGKTGVRLRRCTDGTIEAIVGVPDQGSGSFTMVQRVVAAALGLPAEAVRVRRGNTAEALSDPGAGASRVTHIVGRAAIDACRRLQAELARLGPAAGEIVVEGSFDSAQDGRFFDYTMAAYAVDVTVDPATGATRVTGALLVTDVGEIINPISHDGQIEGGFVFGLGGALLEELPLDEDARVQNPSLGEYKLPTIKDVPPLRTVYVRAPDGDGPYGAKMVGELSNLGVAPAIANAVYDAVGARVTAMPITAERVFAAL